MEYHIFHCFSPLLHDFMTPMVLGNAIKNHVTLFNQNIPDQGIFDPSMALKWPVLGYFHEIMHNYDENKSECVV